MIEHVHPDAALLAVKRELRARVRSARAGRPLKAQAALALKLRDAVLELPEVRGHGRVAAYVSTPGEPGTAPLLEALAAMGIRPLLPVVRPAGVLDWATDTDPAHRRPARGVGGAEPTGRLRGPTALCRADVVLVPALLVDTLGNRLGQGGGYYDRALAHTSSTASVLAVVYDEELLDAAVEAVPAGGTDQQVNGVVTPSQVLRLPRWPPGTR